MEGKYVDNTSNYYTADLFFHILCNYLFTLFLSGSTPWRSWFWHCSVSRKVAGSIFVCVTVIFHSYSPSGQTMVLGSTRPLTQMRSVWLKGSRCVGMTNLPPSCEDFLEICETQAPGNLWNCKIPVQGLLCLGIAIIRCCKIRGP